MLLLVLSHRDIIRLIEQDIRSHQHRIGKQAGVDVVLMLCGFVLELGHPGQLPEHGVAVQDPGKLRMLRNVGLQEKNVLLRVQAAGNVLCQLVDGTLSEIRRRLTHRDGVHIRHEVIALKLIRAVRPVLDGAEVIPEVQVSAGLDARQHSFLGLFHVFVLF